MRRFHPSPRMDIPISMEIYNKLLSASCSHDWQKEDWEITAEAIEEYLRRHDPESIPMAPTKGYQWKSLFLPDGTVLRTVFAGINHHCIVENDQILHNGQAVSPSGFVNAVGGIRRNAWRSTWVLLPENKHWVLADTLRTRERKPRRRKPDHAAKQMDAMPPRDVRPVATEAPAPAAPPAPVATSPSPKPEDSRTRGRGRENHTFTKATGTQTAAQLRPDTFDSPAMRIRGAERRSGSETTTSLFLREQMQQLLNRMFALDDDYREARASRLGPADEI